MTYVLYGSRRSGSCIVECALAELGLAYERREVSLEREEQRKEAYMAINPQRKLPTLSTPTGEILTESVAILLTLSERHPTPALLPPVGSPDRAQALRWLLFVASEIYPVIEIDDYPERFAGPSCSVGDLRERAREIWRRRWLIVEAQVGGDPYLLADGFCLTDLYISVVSRWARQDEWRADHLPKIERLTAAVAARPAIAPVWRRHFG